MPGGPRVYLLSSELGTSGVPRVAYNVCKHLADTDVSVRVGYLGGPDELVSAFRDVGCTVDTLGGGFPEVGQLGAVRRAIEAHDPDVLHTHMVPAALLGHPAALGTDTTVVSTVHNVYTKHTVGAKLLDFPVSHLCDVVVSVSNAVHESLPRSYALGADRRVIHNCIDTDRVRRQGRVPFDELPWRDRVDPDAPIVANVARFDETKGQDDLVRAFPRVLESYPDAQLVMTGWGPMKQELASLAAELGVRENVVFLEKVANPYAVFDHADVIAYPSSFEGFSIAILEAMAFGKPVVATEIGPFVEALGADYPVVPVGDPAAVAAQTVAWLDDRADAQRHGTRLRERVDEQFAGDNAAREHAALYREYAT